MSDRWHAKTEPATPSALPSEREASPFDAAEPRFDELSELGRGGMGRVAEAHDRALGRTVAIKHMLATDETSLARFEREVRITARLQHPGVVPVLEAGRDAEGRPYYVMRKVDGVPLAERVKKRSVRERLALIPAMLSAVDAVAYAHAQGIVHRDIKPWNILLGPFGEALMIDWGLARELDAPASVDSIEPSRPSQPSQDGLTQLGSAYGTPGFMAPEQARGEAADRRADVYSLGATLYFVLAGGMPFAGLAATAIIEKVASGAIPAVGEISSEVPAELVAIAMKALAPDRDARYADAGELAEDLRRFVNGQLVAAHRYTVRERVVKWVRKHRLVTAISTLALVLLVGGGAWSIRRIVSERDNARDKEQLAETRSEDLVIDRARALVRVDPTSAIAALRALPDRSPQWPIARDIVRAAVVGGIDRRVGHLSNRVTAVAFSPGGQLASAALGNVGGKGEIEVHDLSRGTSIVVASVGAGQLGWLDESTLVAWNIEDGKTNGEVRLVDVTTAKITPIAAGAFTDIVIDAGRAVVLRSDGSVVAFGSDGAIVELAPSGIEAIDAAGGRIVMINREHMTILEGTARRERAVAIATRIFHVELSSSGKRVGVHAFRMIYEFTDGIVEPATWPRRDTAITVVRYAGDQLFCWSADGTGLSELRPDRVVTRWLTAPATEVGLEPAPHDVATIFATRDGRIAYANALGVIELPHRPESVSRIAFDGTRRRLAIGTNDGDVIFTDLTSALPEVHSLPASTADLYAIGEGRLVVGALPNLEVIELDTLKRHPLPPLDGFVNVSFENGAIVAFSGEQTRVLVVTDLDGKLIFRGEHLGSAAFLKHVTFINNETGDLVQLDEHWRPQVIAHFEPKSVFEVDETPAGVVVRRMEDAFLIDKAGTHPLSFPFMKEPPNSYYTDADGTWWVIENFQRLWRIPTHGAPTPITLPQSVRQLKEFGNHIYANGQAQIFEIARDGHLVRSTSSVGLIGYIEDGYLLSTGAGPVLVMPASNVRRELRLSTTADRVRVSVDGRLVAATVGDAVAVWRDPVPANPADVRAFIEKLTNAQLDPGSDAVRWE